MRGIQANLNEALRNERLDVPEHVAHPPFHMDFIDSDDANALAFTEGDYSFIGITVALIHRIWESCLPLVQAAEIGTLLGLQLDTGERRTRLHALLFRLQLNFVTTHEYAAQTAILNKKTADGLLYSREARDAANKAEVVAQKNGGERDRRNGVRCDWIQGWAELQAGKTDQAQPLLEQALLECRRINLVESEPDILLTLATLDCKLGDLMRASRDARDALTIAQECKYTLKQADAHLLLARIANQHGVR